MRMGVFGSKEKKPEKTASYQLKRNYFDEHGNLRLGNRPLSNFFLMLTERIPFSGDKPRDKKVELEKFVELENSADQGAETWNIVSTLWIQAWLAFVHYNKSSPAPGPCNNEVLLRVDTENNCWVAKEGIRMATSKVTGDYRRVSTEMWKEICALYPGSGPEIKVDFVEVKSCVVDIINSRDGILLLGADACWRRSV